MLRVAADLRRRIADRRDIAAWRDAESAAAGGFF
jgi:hypothetical protein